MRLVLSAAALLLVAGCQTSTFPAKQAEVEQPVAVAKPSVSAPAKPIYNPAGREQFVFVTRDAKSQIQGYPRFCKEASNSSCDPALDYPRYVGMRGYFESIQPEATHDGQAFYPVVLQNGERFFYKVPERTGKFRGDAPIAPFRQFGSEADVFNEPLVPGSPIQLQGIVVNDGQTNYTLSNGKEVSEPHFALIREVAALLGTRGPEVAEVLIDLEISKDGKNRFFVNPRGSILRSEFRLYMGLTPERSATRLRVKYYAVDWLFVDHFAVQADDFIWQSKKLPFKRDHAAGEGWEWVDLPVSRKELELASKLANADRAILRFFGEKSAVHQMLAADQKEGLRQMLRLHRLVQEAAPQD